MITVRNQYDYDVAIVGGGPVGSTASTLLKKYAPELRVLVLEKETFPRDHIGESQLPAISGVLHEMEVWDKVEAAGFPIKIGASYTWGRNNDRWDFDFYPVELWKDEPRPARYEGQRTLTAFQVDRSLYDKVLLDHAQSFGVEVRQGVKVSDVICNGDRIEGLKLADGQTITAEYYIDGSGTVALFRRAMNIGIDPKLELRNIAIWDYWTNAEWAVEIGVGATRVQIRSLPYGWIWFIPIGPTRTSIGLVCPAEYYKASGLTPEELYHKSLQIPPDICKLLHNATSRGQIETCRDWSHLADRIVGENWFLCGEAAGFADPILAAGMSLAHHSARDAAYTILEYRRGEHDRNWLRRRFDQKNRDAIRQHIRFAQYWYSANSCFSDLREYCAQIAKDAGLKLAPQDAWAWLSQGGFTNESAAIVSAGSFDMASAKQLLELFDAKGRKAKWLMDGYNVFKLNLRGAETENLGWLENGRIIPIPMYVRGDKRLPYVGYYGDVIDVLQQTSDAQTILEKLQRGFLKTAPVDRNFHLGQRLQAIEVMIQDGWVERKIDKKRPMVRLLNKSRFIRSARETQEALHRSGRDGLIKSRIDHVEQPQQAM